MTEQPWQPFGLSDAELVEFSALRDGVPPTMRESLLSWLEACVRTSTHGWLDRMKLLEMQNVCHLDLGVQAGSHGAVAREQVISSLRKAKPELWLRMTDYFVSTMYQSSGMVSQLQSLLSQGGSRWTVGQRQGKLGLVELVPRGVQDAVEGIVDSSAQAGQLLARAWNDVHKLEPQDSSAYALAVRAVETVAIAVVMPRKTDATLGNVIGQMQADADWRLPLREAAKAPSAEVLLGMLRTVWAGHRDRHGSLAYSDVTHDEARVAVTLAATLVDWFASGAVQRRSV